ncbi:proprotein convertase P-domain-containing protein [Marivirga sp. S37H4]|uniref:Proprotein convertase P-domain-containing protein n=1 Tax=Marivirga aurantiaca TaxID=2802615 RepID=A0A934X2J3_9BACT|nr:zinc-dependent metalloprotease family protein [Marivirga aurantiaca]MBK6267287.1 proprotein convertase P-domain-containing protein [Marivirga aurantiaca]
MNKLVLKTLLLLSSILISLNANGQTSNLWIQNSDQSVNLQKNIPVHSAKYYSLKTADLVQSLKPVSKTTKRTITIPYPDGTTGDFLLEEISTMSDKLAAKYPMIKTYSGRNIANGDVIRMDVTHKGFHGMVFTKNGQFFIDPINKNNINEYQVYYKKDLVQTEKSQHFEEAEPIIYNKTTFEAVKRKVETGNFSKPAGTELRTYRIAIAATGEYTQFHGGTVEDGLAAIVTTLNRVSGIYEKNVAVKMVLVDNNDQIIFTDSNSDPFSNSDAGSMINELQTEIDATIGSDNYDIGHGFSTGAGGLAGLGVVCSSDSKARGVTGTNNPTGDPFDVDYVAHEIGHQFGAPHTFNGVVGSCSGGNRSGSSAYEPGSGTTIMAYAGICGSDNIQNNSDAYFHVTSLDYINAYSQESGGNSCATITDTENNIPVVDAGTGGFTIPVNTPFQLNGSATDPDGDAISYSWEQFDLGPAGSPNSPVDNAPIFRSFSPTTDTFRVFPQISDILSGTQTIGELLPTYSRDLTFRLIARDNQAVSGVDYDEISFSATEEAGPFLVEDVTGEFDGLSTLSVVWDVANTNTAPVNCQKVNIYLSLDGGQTFTETLKENTPNDGNENITLANVNTTEARIKVAAADNIFFNISSSNFSITETTDPTYVVTTSFDKEKYCPTDDIILTIQTESILGYNEEINFSSSNIPTGLSGSFSITNILPGETTVLTLDNTEGISGQISLDINTSSGSITKDENIAFSILNNPVPPTITSPADGSSTEGILPVISWEDDNLEVVYDLQIATDQNFSNIIESVSDINGNSYALNETLSGGTNYFVRIMAKNFCDESAYAEISFTTQNIDCVNTTSDNVPVEIPTSVATVESTLLIEDSGEIEMLSVKNLIGTHTYISDLVISLRSPMGTEVVLMDKVCGSEENFNISFSDQADDSSIPCPPTDEGTYQPATPLSVFNGENMQGEWTLIVEDVANQDGGQLENWDLEICVTNLTLAELSRPTNLTGVEDKPGEIILTWTDNSDNETAFVIERMADGEENFGVLTEVDPNTSQYIDKSILELTKYTYRVKAINANTESIYSNEVEITTQLGLPSAPTDFSMEYGGDGYINLLWVDNSENESAYVIERRILGEDEFETTSFLPENSTTYEERLPDLSKTYQYRVFAQNTTGNSDYSETLDASLVILGTKDELNNQIVLYPNPTNSVIHIQNNSNNTIHQIRIRNTLGQSVKVISGKSESIDIRELQPGLYFVQIEINKEHIVKQIVIKN